ncbi:hypothetical protein QZH41_009502 [Actinostola sp. cb2023]|nr:hypothetical protein QZH41_009502 [Actinostola sp. cb2023]
MSRNSSTFLYLSLMFWTDWGSKPRIQRATLSGHNQTTIVNLRPLRQRWPHGIALDYSTNRLYWIDSYDDVIMSVTFNGEDKFEHRTFRNVHVFSLDMDGMTLYFSDSATKSIRTVDKESGANTGRYYDVDSTTNVGVTVYDLARQPNGNRACVNASHDCQFLCLLTPSGSICACPDGQVLEDDGQSCRDVERFLLFTESTFDNIYRIPIETGSQNVAQRIPLLMLSKPTAVDFDPIEERVYWSDLNQRSIYRSFLNGSSQQRIVGRLGSPSSLAVDWAGRNLYWADKPANKIEVSKLDGKYRKTLIYGNLEQPLSITLDLKKGSQACIYNNGNCSHLCLLRPSGAKCACPDDMILKDDGKTCYVKEFLMYADAGSSRYAGIYKLPLDDLSKGYLPSYHYQTYENQQHWTLTPWRTLFIGLIHITGTYRGLAAGRGKEERDYHKRRYQRSSTTVPKFQPSDVLVIGEPKPVYQGIEVETVVLQPHLDSQSGLRQPIPGSLLCAIVHDAKNSLLKRYGIVVVNGEKEPKCQGMAAIGKSKGNDSREGSSSAAVSGSLAGGILVAAVLLLVLVLVFLYFYRKRKQRQRLLEEPINGQNVTFNNPGFLEDPMSVDTPLSSPTYEEVDSDIRDHIFQTDHRLYKDDLRGAGNPVYHEIHEHLFEIPASTGPRVAAGGSSHKAEILEKLKLEEGTRGEAENGGNFEDADDRYMTIPAMDRVTRNILDTGSQHVPNEPVYATISESIRRSKRARREDPKDGLHGEDEKSGEKSPAYRDNTVRPETPSDEPEYASIPTTTSGTSSPPILPPKQNNRRPIYENINTDKENKEPGDKRAMEPKQPGRTQNLPNIVPTLEGGYANGDVSEEISAEVPDDKRTYVNVDGFGETDLKSLNEEMYVNANAAEDPSIQAIYANEEAIKRNLEQYTGQLPNGGKPLPAKTQPMKSQTEQFETKNAMGSQTNTDAKKSAPVFQETKNHRNYIHEVQGINSNEESFT